MMKTIDVQTNTLNVFLWKVTLSDLIRLRTDWVFYVVATDAISAGNIALKVRDDEEMPDIKSIEWVAHSVVPDPRCVLSRAGFITIADENHT